MIGPAPPSLGALNPDAENWLNRLTLAEVGASPTEAPPVGAVEPAPPDWATIPTPDPAAAPVVKVTALALEPELTPIVEPVTVAPAGRNA